MAVLPLLLALSFTACGLLRKPHLDATSGATAKQKTRKLALQFEHNDSEGTPYTIQTRGTAKNLVLNKLTTRQIEVLPDNDTLRVLMPWNYAILNEPIPPDAEGVTLIVDRMREHLRFLRKGEDAEQVYALAKESFEGKPFQIQSFPILPSCEAIAQDSPDMRVCFQRVLGRIVSRRFNIDVAEGQNIRLQLHITLDSTGQHQLQGVGGAISSDLVDEVKRVMSYFPKAKPVTHRGRAVSTQYVLPIQLRFQ